MTRKERSESTATATGGIADPESLALVSRMGSHPRAFAYLDTLARVAGLTRDVAAAKLEALEQHGLVTSEPKPAGQIYRLTEAGVRARQKARETQ
jgi:DNA-binding MarR family transcriptional regulator